LDYNGCKLKIKNINMKQLLSLFLFLLPCLAWAQYPSNGNQKITLGEQSTADGLIYRGRVTDTTLTVKSDTAAYFVLDTVNLNLYTYKASATGRKWIQLGSDTTSLNLVSRFAAKLNISDTASMLTNYWRAGRFSGVLPVANGGTGSAAQNFVDLTNTQTVGGAKTFTSAITATSGVFASGNQGLIIGPYTSPGLSTGAIYLSGITPTNQNFIFGANPTITTLNTFKGGSISLSVNGAPNGVILDSLNRLGVGLSAPTANLHLKVGSSAPKTAPLKFTSGVLMTTPEVGAMEFVLENLYFTTTSEVRHNVNHGLKGSATLNFPSTTTLLSADLTITVTGAADGDVVSLGVPNAAVNANTSYSAWVSAANTVTVRFNNYSIGTVDPASALFKVFVTK
jgi:hypothetical protein